MIELHAPLKTDLGKIVLENTFNDVFKWINVVALTMKFSSVI